jgi:hypothetical protein
MKPRDIVKAATVVGWGAGLALILAGFPVAIAFAAFAGTPAAAAACTRLRVGRRAWLKVRAIHRPARRTRTETALDRA